MNIKSARAFARAVFRDTEAPPEQFAAVSVSAAAALPDLEHIVGGNCEDGTPAALGFANERVYGLRVIGGDEFTSEMWSWARDKVDVIVTDSFVRIRRMHSMSDMFDGRMRRTWRFASGDRAVDVTDEFEAEDRGFSPREATCQALADAIGAVFEPPPPR